MAVCVYSQIQQCIVLNNAQQCLKMVVWTEKLALLSIVEYKKLSLTDTSKR
jgi:hypothetical protein